MKYYIVNGFGEFLTGIHKCKFPIMGLREDAIVFQCKETLSHSLGLLHRAGFVGLKAERYLE